MLHEYSSSLGDKWNKPQVPQGHCDTALIKLSFYPRHFKPPLTNAVSLYFSPYWNSRPGPQCQASVVHQFGNCVDDLEGNNQFNPINLAIQNIAGQFNDKKKDILPAER